MNILSNLSCIWSKSIQFFNSSLQALAQEVSDFVSSVKVKMTEEGTMAALRTVMKLCTLSASPEAQVRHQLAGARVYSLTLFLLGCRALFIFFRVVTGLTSKSIVLNYAGPHFLHFLHTFHKHSPCQTPHRTGRDLQAVGRFSGFSGLAVSDPSTTK